MTFTITLPNGWHLTHIILLDPDWQINASGENHVVVGTGSTIEEAASEVCSKIYAGKYVGNRFRLSLHRAPEQSRVPLEQLVPNLMAKLRAAQPKINRRF